MILNCAQRENLARKAFELAELIDGGTTGGLIPRRILLGVKSEHKTRKSVIRFRYKYPAEVHPCSDVTYHMENPDKTYDAVYEINSFGSFCLEGGVEPFSRDYLEHPIYIKMVNSLYEEYLITEKKQDAWLKSQYR